MHEASPKARDVSRLWRIHGRFYDLEPYAKRHPGGALIELGRGQDCTALWESVHFSTSVPAQILARFEVAVLDADAGVGDGRAGGGGRYGQPIFRWEPDGFYRTLQRRVRAHFRGDPGRAKAPRAFFFRWALLFALWMFAVYRGLWNGSWAWAALGGFIMEVLDLTVTHDGSHAAISRRPWVNRLASYTQYLYFWAHPIWLQHHVYAHHSFTGIHGLDPDLDNNALQRKHGALPARLWHRLQGITTWLYLPWLLSVLQGLFYLLAAFTRTPIFGVEFRLGRRDWVHALLLWTLSAAIHFVAPFLLLPAARAALVLAVYYASQSLYYFLTVAPNHDGEETVRHGEATLTVEQLKKAPIDWGEKQVRSTANFRILDDAWSERLNPILGGMHYQIEHHLFPSVSHCHYPELAPIVRATCQEFGIPYHSPSWLAALAGFQRALTRLGRPKRAAIPLRAVPGAAPSRKG